jgi:CheY-like chemotaxis protein
MPNNHPEFTILVVEFSRFFRYALCESLQSRFVFPVMTRAASIQQALPKIDSMRPDMIFLDASLPDGDGLELTRRLRAAGNKAVISILANQDLPEQRQAALHSGAQHFIVKGGTDISEIYAVVDAALAPRFRTLIVAEDTRYHDQMSALLSRTRPGALVACTSDWDEALDIAGSLKPNLIMLRSEAGADRKQGFCEELRTRCTDKQMKIFLVSDARPQGAQVYPARPGVFNQQRAAIVSSIRSRLNGLSTATWS